MASEFACRTYNILIIGGGTAGLALATRLSEDNSVQVGVLEAGPAVADDVVIDVPGRYGEALGSLYDWQFQTTPQTALGGREVPWARGKMLGGSSAINFMTWNRPNKEDLDAWEALGNKGWCFDAMLPFYKMSERFHPPNIVHQREHQLYFDGEFMGTEGPISISYNREYSVSHQYWHPTLNRLGIPTNKNHLSGSNVGVWTSIVAVDPHTGTRSYSASTYYQTVAKKRANLSVLTDALVREVRIEQVEGVLTATGVTFTYGKQQYTVSASHDIVLSAGSIASPQLLELSGIGNPKVLQAAGIAVKVANPNVGENLQDHLFTATIYEVNPSIPSPDDLKTDPATAAAAHEAYRIDKTGPRTIVPCSMCYVPLSQFVPQENLDTLAARATEAVQFLQISQGKRNILARRFTEARSLGQMEFIFEIGNWNSSFHVEPGRKYATMLQLLQYPLSFGSIHIPPKSSGAKQTTVDAKPIIDPRYYDGRGGQLDMEIMRMSVEYGHKIAQTPPLSNFVKGRVWPPVGADWMDWVRDNTTTDWHPVGTCSLGGTEAAAGGVVDERLRVYGVRSLRVVDASIMPLQISAHLQATVYAIAEKAAVMIMEDLRA